MHKTIIKMKNHKKITNLSFKLKKKWKYDYMSKIFPKIYLKFDLKYFHSIVFKVLLLCYHQITIKNYSYLPPV